MSTLSRDSYCLAVPVFLVIESTSVFDTREELLREEIKLLQEGYSIECLGTSYHEALHCEDHARDDHGKEGHRYHELEDGESFFISG